ncbi:MAG: phosphodiester glycosidase family protein [Deltaproteobacteria bacterium]|nr:phosphodiester glycosidase family protein [Deltaproteobacteria bacterium]MBW1873211.1 phosphodiester glycosidase family protein [Deltaproteobacteria bacterium]
MAGFFTAFLLIVVSQAAPEAIQFKELEPGLELAFVSASKKSSHADSKFTLVRINPKHQQLKLLMVSQLGGRKQTAPAWAKQHDLTLVVNAGMFEAEGDQSRATFFMKNFEHVNNLKLAGQNAFLAFNPKNKDLAAVQIIDRRCQNFAQLSKQYETLIQGIRMVDCHQKNTWSLQPKKWSMVVVAMDKHDRVIFIFSRSPYRVHNFIKMLMKLPLDIRNMMYLEGGPEASLFLTSGDTKLAKFGSYETGFFESDTNKKFWPIPNVIGVARRQPGPD